MKVPSVDTLVGRRCQRVGRPFTSEQQFPRSLQFVAFTSDRSNLFTVETLNVESNAASVNQRETHRSSSASSSSSARSSSVEGCTSLIAN